MSQLCASTQADAILQQLSAENDELRRYLAAQKQVIASLERRVGRSLDSLGIHVKQLTGTPQSKADWRQSINFVEDEVNSLRDLLADAMLLQKLEAGKVDVKLEALLLHPILSFITRPLIKQSSTVRLICEFEPIAIPVQADHELLEAVLTDLLARGLRYSDPDLAVVLGVEYSDRQAQIYITAQRFAPVGDRDFATEIVLCCRRVEVQGGTVTCQQRPDGLQTVIVTLPTGINKA